MAEEKPVDRRRFFRAALGEVFKPFSKAAAPIERAARELAQLDSSLAKPAPKPPSRPAKVPTGPRNPALSLLACLRPPGALPEPNFVETCSRCGDCVQACPVDAIRIEPGGRGGGFPLIDPAVSPCVMCAELRCMQHCPTGALVPTPRGEIHMGTAAWREPKCLRSSDEPCTICLEACPVGADAIRLVAGLIHVDSAHCTGCGVCERACPTKPKALVVKPRP